MKNNRNRNFVILVLAVSCIILGLFLLLNSYLSFGVEQLQPHNYVPLGTPPPTPPRTMLNILEITERLKP